MSGVSDFIARPRTIGETWVWLTGMGLVAALVMIIGLFGFICYRGVIVFWPTTIVELELSQEAQERFGLPEKIAGRYLGESPRVAWPSTVDEMRPGGGLPEKKYFIGNEESYGSRFGAFTSDEVVARTKPLNLLVAERLEFGEAFLYPVEIKLSNGGAISADSPDFLTLFREELNQINQRRKAIQRLEKVQIGQISWRIEKLRTEERGIRRKGEPVSSSDAARLERIEEELSGLENRYRVFALEARSLRELQGASHLVYRLPHGELDEISLDKVNRVYAPNRLNLWQKVRLYVESLHLFLTESPRESNTAGGIFPAIFGTFVMTVLMSAAVLPFGVIAALYLHEYARQGPLVRLVRISVLNLAGVPSIVFGVFGLGFFVYFIGGGIDSLFFSERLPTATFGTGGIFWASLTLALMTVPVVIVATEEALAAVPAGLREASYACGASKWQTTVRVLIPGSLPGILTGLILAMARGAGEVAPLMLVGVVKLAPSLPINLVPPFIHLDRKFMHLGFHIYDLGFQSPNAEAALPMVFASTVLLILLVVVLNIGAILLRNHLRRKYTTDTF